MGEYSQFLMFDGESSDESDDSYAAEDVKIYTARLPDLYSTSSSSHQSSRG